MRDRCCFADAQVGGAGCLGSADAAVCGGGCRGAVGVELGDGPGEVSPFCFIVYRTDMAWNGDGLGGG